MRWENYTLEQRISNIRVEALDEGKTIEMVTAEHDAAASKLTAECRESASKDQIEIQRLAGENRRLKERVAEIEGKLEASEHFEKSQLKEARRLSKLLLAEQSEAAQKPRPMDEEPGEGVWVWTVRRYRFGSRPKSPDIRNWYDADDYQLHGEVDGWIPCPPGTEEVG